MNFILYPILILTLFVSGCKTNNNSNFSASDEWIGEPDSGFRDLKKLEGTQYMVVAAHELASKAGAEIIEKGGNAIDAAIATQLVLNVVEPHSSGIGGGSLMLYHEQKSGKNFYFNGRETAPQNISSNAFLDKNNKPREFSDVVRGGLSVGTPGTLKLMKETHQKYGKLPWKDLFKPAIKIASEGFVVTQRFHNLSKEISYLKDFDQTASIYLNKNKEPFAVGEKITNLELAKTFEEIANNGISSFYEGKIANDIVESVQNSKINPGKLSLSDLKNYQVRKSDLLCANYRQNYKICTASQPSSGVTMLQILGILENFDLSKLQPNSAEAVHLISEATRLAYADRNEYLGHDLKVSLNQMLDKKYLKSRASLIKKDQKITQISAGFANKKSTAISLFEPPSTTHMSIVDKEGNAVSMTSSIEYFFGSALSVDGFLMNNQLTDFAFEPVKNGKKVANRLEAGKQPRTSMSPTFIFDKNDNLVMIVGSPGGPRIIQFVTKTIINHLDFGLDIQQSISLPSFIVLNDVIELEKNRDITKLKPELEKLGHQVKIIEIVSGISAISLDRNKLEGGADPRREGFATGR
jgi:gamma-glutamyltranspeptidase / glutathione hydrolase